MMTNSSKCEQINGGVTIIAGYPRVHKCLRVIVLCTVGKITQIHGKFTYAYAYIHTVPGHPGYPDTRAGYPGTLGTRYGYYYPAIFIPGYSTGTYPGTRTRVLSLLS